MRVAGRIGHTLHKKEVLTKIMVVPLHKEGWTYHLITRILNLSTLQWNLKDVLLDNERWSRIMKGTRLRNARISEW